MDQTAIHAFAVKWYRVFARWDGTAQSDLLTGGFERECQALGFWDDGGEALIKECETEDIFKNNPTLRWSLDGIESVGALGNGIMAQVRRIREKGIFSLDGMPFAIQKWFCLAFGCLERMTAEGESELFFGGRLVEAHLVSECLDSEDRNGVGDRRQALHFLRDIGISFERVRFGGESEWSPSLILPDEEYLDNMFIIWETEFSEIFSEKNETPEGWTLELVNEKGERRSFQADFLDDPRFTSYSKMVREVTDSPWFHAFDGNGRVDRIERIEIQYYQKRRKVWRDLTNGIPFAEECECYEGLVLDRKDSSLRLRRQDEEMNRLESSYSMGSYCRDLLDDIWKENLFAEVANRKRYEDTDPDLFAEYTIRVDFKVAPRMIKTGLFDSRGIPTDYPEFIAKINEFVRRFGGFEIVSPNYFLHRKRHFKDLIYCQVYIGAENDLWAVADEDLFREGDYVSVAVGPSAENVCGRVERVEYFTPEEAPVPAEEADRILGAFNGTDQEARALIRAAERRTVTAYLHELRIEEAADSPTGWHFLRDELVGEALERVRELLSADLLLSIRTSFRDPEDPRLTGGTVLTLGDDEENPILEFYTGELWNCSRPSAYAWRWVDFGEDADFPE